MTGQVFYIKNLNCECCFRLIERELNRMNIPVTEISSGKIILENSVTEKQIDTFRILLEELDLHQLKSKEQILIEKIKSVAIDLIYNMNNQDSIIRKSEYMVEMLNMNYAQISRFFSKHEPITLEKYMINLKIERVKELIDEDEFTLSEIAYLMDYSSLQHLSNQFKKITGYTFSEYKTLQDKPRKTLSQLEKI